jgi:hypothetical protein
VSTGQKKSFICRWFGLSTCCRASREDANRSIHPIRGHRKCLVWVCPCFFAYALLKKSLSQLNSSAKGHGNLIPKCRFEWLFAYPGVEKSLSQLYSSAKGHGNVVPKCIFEWVFAWVAVENIWEQSCCFARGHGCIFCILLVCDNEWAFASSCLENVLAQLCSSARGHGILSFDCSCTCECLSAFLFHENVLEQIYSLARGHGNFSSKCWRACALAWRKFENFRKQLSSLAREHGYGRLLSCITSTCFFRSFGRTKADVHPGSGQTCCRGRCWYITWYCNKAQGESFRLQPSSVTMGQWISCPKWWEETWLLTWEGPGNVSVQLKNGRIIKPSLVLL